MTRNELFQLISRKQSFLCIGLDSDIDKIPKHLLESEDPVYEFNRRIIDATHAYAVAYKPNLAFYESRGVKGWASLEKTMAYLHQLPDRPFIIADAKRGDIGNTAGHYAKAFFEHLNADAITLSPYMGEDAIAPFLAYQGKWAIILALTSNKGAQDFQFLQTIGGNHLLDSVLLHETIIQKAKTWGSSDHIMFVIGATQADKLSRLRSLAPEHFFLVPGVGAQGGDLAAVAQNGMNGSCGLLVNASRSIIFARNDDSFDQAAGEEAKRMQAEMAGLLEQFLKN